MRNQAFVDLLTDLHRSIDRVANEVARDMPALAAALRRRAAWIPRPEDVSDAPPLTSSETPRALPPLLYSALDEGLIDGAKFDALMVSHTCAQSALKSRTA